VIQGLPTTELSATIVGDIVRQALAPVFLLSGIGAFLNVCASRLSRIVDRSRQVEPLLLGSAGAEHDRWLGEMHVLDRRMALVSWAITLSVLSAVLTCLGVSLLCAASLTRYHFGTAIARGRASLCSSEALGSSTTGGSANCTYSTVAWRSFLGPSPCPCFRQY